MSTMHGGGSIVTGTLGTLGTLSTSSPKFLTTSMKEKSAERHGARRVVFGVKRLPKSDDPGVPETKFPYGTAGNYVGSWSKDQKEGFGTQTWASGSKYEGEWSEGKMSGKGSLWKLERSKLRKQYAGDWVDGKRTGLGVYLFANGDKYEGEWQRNERHGNGAMTFSEDGSHYEGGWHRGRRTGLGVQTMSNGDRFEGHWLQDQKEGPGRYLYLSTAKVYEGEWVQGSPKCGVFRKATQQELQASQEEEEELSPECFELPQLTLLNANSIVSLRVAEIRQERTKRNQASEEEEHSQQIRVFDSAELEVLQRAFSEQDRHGEALVPASAVGYILEKTRIFAVQEAAVDRLLAELEADQETRITFAEFVDMAALLTTDNV